MRDIESYYAAWKLTPDLIASRDSLRVEYQTTGWAKLGQGMMEDILAGTLIQHGRAAIRIEGGSMVGYVRAAVEYSGTSPAVVRHQTYYLPDGRLLFRVFDGSEVSFNGTMTTSELFQPRVANTVIAIAEHTARLRRPGDWSGPPYKH